MNDRDVWDIYFAGICSIRFHPKNDGDSLTVKDKVKAAAEIATLMLDERRSLWRGWDS